MERAVDYALLAQAHQLALFHHDPDRSDEAIDRLCARARARVATAGSALQVCAAAEGQAIALPQGPPRRRPAGVPAASALLARAPRGASTVLIVDDDPDLVRVLETELHAEGVRVLTATTGEEALRLARQTHPTLILLDLNLPGIDGLAVCHLLRADPDPHLRTVAIVMLTGVKLHETDLVAACRAGATDYLTKPVKPTLIRSRVRAWLLRTATV
jgi:CheY-like chemotaxis protein